MLALNKALQKAGIQISVRFSRVQYAPSEFILALFIEKADIAILIFLKSNLLI